MANVSSDLLSDDLYRNMLLNSIWQNQISSGANIANMGGKTALGLMIGAGLGNWLGNKFWNYQQNKINSAAGNTSNVRPDVHPDVVKAVAQNIFGNADLGWTPPNQYQFGTPQEYFANAVRRYTPNWQQQTANSILPIRW